MEITEISEVKVTTVVIKVRGAVVPVDQLGKAVVLVLRAKLVRNVDQRLNALERPRGRVRRADACLAAAHRRTGTHGIILSPWKLTP